MAQGSGTRVLEYPCPPGKLMFSDREEDSFEGTETVTAWYDQTITAPCPGAAAEIQNIVFIKWKYVKDDGTAADLLVKQVRSNQVTIQATDGYAQRVSIDDKYSLLITKASLRDQKTFTCMVVSPVDIKEYLVQVFVHKKPFVQVLDKSEVLLKDKLTTVGTCMAADANPAANITWRKDGKLLAADGKAVVLTPSLKLNPATGLSTTSSTLQYAASKEDADAIFTCVSTYELLNQELSLEPFPVHYPSENITLQVLSRTPIVEGNNVTLKCHGDGNPPPTSFLFHFQGRKTLVENSDSYTLTSISREAAGEYRCSLLDNKGPQGIQTILVNYLDLDLSPSGKVLKVVGENLSVTIQKNSSEEAPVLWTKDGKTVEKLEFNTLTYADAGVYMFEVSVPGLRRQRSFELLVEGKPVITNLTESTDADRPTHKNVTCEAEAIPEPQFTWSINATAVKNSYIKRKASQTITFVSSTNLTISCIVRNKHGEDVKTINISDKEASDLQSQNKELQRRRKGWRMVRTIEGSSEAPAKDTFFLDSLLCQYC
ncbi:CD166 antigen homolog [Xenentodon cancila]